ncbi:MAG: potassium channel family protein [Acholeplasmataceae bacterium]
MKTKYIASIWLGLMLILIFTSTIIYMATLSVGFLDGLYMTIITISTVGFKEVADMTPQAKIFTIILIILSIFMVGYLLSAIVSYFSGGEFYETWRKKKMNKVIETLKDHIILCGAGETGIYVAKQLEQAEATFVIIEQDPDIIEEIKTLGFLYVYEDATREESLKAANIKDAKGLITTLPKDADNVYVVLTARELRPDIHIIARAHEERSDRKLKRAGANETVSPNEIGGKKLALLMLKPKASHFMDHIIDTGNIELNLEEVQIEEGSELSEKMLKESKIAEKTGLIVLAIRKESNNEFIFNPNANQVLKAFDTMIVVGEKSQIYKLQSLAKGLNHA